MPEIIETAISIDLAINYHVSLHQRRTHTVCATSIWLIGGNLYKLVTQKLGGVSIKD